MTVSISPCPSGLASGPEWLAQALDPGSDLIRLVRMNVAAYRAASFLDDRILQQPIEALLCRWGEVAAVAGSIPHRDARWIFHIGHVGSTLVSRLLGELAGVLAIREPRILRDLGQVDAAALNTAADHVTRLLSRRFTPDERVLVKATSFVSEFAPRLCPPGGRALFLHASPRAYIRGILAGENSRKELAILGPVRLARMAHRVAPMPEAERSDAHRAAAAWACEMTSLEQAAMAMPDRAIAWADFDTMLADMPAALADAVRALDLPSEPQALAEILRGPLMGRYSKALEYDYSPALRRDLLDEAGRNHRAAIEDAVAMLHKAATTSPLLARALARADLEA